MEQRKDIKGFEEFYQISNLGRIKSKDRYLRTCGNGVRFAKGRIIKPVIMMSKDGNEIKKFRSLVEATRETGADASSLIRVCKGKQNTCVGYKWKYA